MNTLAWICILFSLLILRGVSKGRSFTQIPGDLSDLIEAVISSDTARMNEVLSRTGDASTPTTVNMLPGETPNGETITPKVGKPDKAGLIAFGKMLQEKGYQVGEHPAFGVVHKVHVTNSQHYKGEAIDVNADHGFKGGEKAALDNANKWAKAAGFTTIWQAPGHYDHLHVAVPR